MTPLVLLHGFLGCAEDWQAICARLEPERPCFPIDLPGHGAAPEPLPADATFLDVVDMLMKRLDGLGLERFDLLGYSMGGRLALGLLLEHPQRVRRAIAVGASPGLSGAAERRKRAELDGRRASELASGPFESWLRAWYAQPLFEALAKSAAFPAVLARRLQGEPSALSAALRALSPGRQPPLRERLRACPVPLLLVAGAEDERYAALGRELAATSPAIEDAYVPQAGHAPHLESPEAFLAVVRSFLGRAEPGHR